MIAAAPWIGLGRRPMKQLGLYLLYVVILFVIQTAVILVCWTFEVGQFIIAIYFGVAAIISAITFMFGLDDLLVGLGAGPDYATYLVFFITALLTLTYSLLIGAVLWAFTFFITLILDNIRTK